MDGWQFLVRQPGRACCLGGWSPSQTPDQVGTSIPGYGWAASKGQAAKGNPSGCPKTACEGRSVSCLCWPNFHFLHDLKREMDLGSNDFGFLKLDQCWPECSDFYSRANRSNTWYPAVWNRDCTTHRPQLRLTEEFGFLWRESEKGLCLVWFLLFPTHSFLPFLGWETLLLSSLTVPWGTLWQHYPHMSQWQTRWFFFFLLQHCMAYIHTRMRKKNGSLNYHPILQLELFCQRSGKWNEIPYVKIFKLLSNKYSAHKGSKLMMQRQRLKRVRIVGLLRESRGKCVWEQQVKQGKNEKLRLLQSSNPLPWEFYWPQMWIITEPHLPQFLFFLAMPWEAGMVSLFKTLQDTKCGQEAPQFGTGRFLCSIILQEWIPRDSLPETIGHRHLSLSQTF